MEAPLGEHIVHDVRVEGARISCLTAGTGPEHVLLLHGLGSSMTSFFGTIAALTPQYTVHALDFPGFGSSSKPVRAAYDAAYFARTTIDFMDTLAIDRAHLIGNSMGGRVAIEMGLQWPQRVRTIAALTPAVAFRRRRELVPFVRLLRPELAAIPHPLSEGAVRSRFWSLFAQPERLDPAVADIACEEFCRSYRSRSARIAFWRGGAQHLLGHPRLVQPGLSPRHAPDCRRRAWGAIESPGPGPRSNFPNPPTHAVTVTLRGRGGRL